MAPAEARVVAAARRCVEVRLHGYTARAEAMDELAEALSAMDAGNDTVDVIALMAARIVELRQHPEVVTERYVWAVEADQVKVEDFAFARAQELEEFSDNLVKKDQ